MAIMYVEDDQLLRQTIAKSLRRSGYEIVEASSGEEAIEFARGHEVDTVILDVELPGIDGIETYRQLRQFQPRVAGVVLSGSLSQSARSALVELGVPQDCMLGKPCAFSQLKTILRGVT
jgi:DNA-binding response OmpR family regulator